MCKGMSSPLSRYFGNSTRYKSDLAWNLTVTALGQSIVIIPMNGVTGNRPELITG